MAAVAQLMGTPIMTAAVALSILDKMLAADLELSREDFLPDDHEGMLPVRVKR